MEVKSLEVKSLVNCLEESDEVESLLGTKVKLRQKSDETTNGEVSCSRCEKFFIIDKWGISDNCHCPFVISTIPLKCNCKRKDLSFLHSILVERYENCRITPGYGSKHDMTTFAFIDPFTGKELTRDEIIERHLWIDKDEEMNICDDCIDKMLLYKELKEVEIC